MFVLSPPPPTQLSDWPADNPPYACPYIHGKEKKGR